tara:strand:- start:19 stop:408 length:390 start_codon:yes stop_codon:yes gene_type:complete
LYTTTVRAIDGIFKLNFSLSMDYIIMFNDLAILLVVNNLIGHRALRNLFSWFVPVCYRLFRYGTSRYYIRDSFVGSHIGGRWYPGNWFTSFIVQDRRLLNITVLFPILIDNIIRDIHLILWFPCVVTYQ